MKYVRIVTNVKLNFILFKHDQRMEINPVITSIKDNGFQKLLTNIKS